MAVPRSDDVDIDAFLIAQKRSNRFSRVDIKVERLRSATTSYLALRFCYDTPVVETFFFAIFPTFFSILSCRSFIPMKT